MIFKICLISHIKLKKFVLNKSIIDRVYDWLKQIYDMYSFAYIDYIIEIVDYNYTKGIYVCYSEFHIATRISLNFPNGIALNH